MSFKMLDVRKRGDIPLWRNAPCPVPLTVLRR